METRALNFVAWLTWVAVAVPTVTWELRHHSLATPRGLGWLACYVLFLIFYALHERAHIPSIVAQSAAAIACCALQQVGWQPILLVIIAGQLGRLPLRTSLPWIAAQTLAMSFTIDKADGTIAIVIVYFAFQLFGLLMSRIANNEAEARQQLAEANAELRVATELLDMNSRTAERLRIARDLHDLLGHHLAALSINLEVARHLTDGEAREQVEKSQAVTRLLLSDVRDVVSRMREDEPVDLTAAVQSLSDVIRQPALHLELAPGLALKDAAVAQIALRAVQEIVTNSVRHSGARNLWLKLTSIDNMLTIESRDDGCGTDAVRFGNGLRGMRERVEQARGSIEVSSMRGSGFNVAVRLPL